MSETVRARVRSCTGSGGGTWLRDLPAKHGRGLSSAELNLSLRQLLGLPLPGVRALSRCSIYSQPHDAAGTQRLHHCTGSTGSWALRHNLIRAALATQLRQWRLDLTLEASGHHQDRQLLPDIVARHPRKGKLYAIDVKATLALQKTYLHKAPWETGYTAKKVEKFKESKYRDAVGDHNQDTFVPFCMETFGRMGTQADQSLKEVTLHLQDPSTQVSEARATLNRSLWKGNALIATQARRVDEADYEIIP
mmetsp:Transcript_7834/g.11630  ORF Transcript_7834/g.11630 Transcript_7834/m.11630 type:complete len:250 (-) Transcript_7834:110-859(-)